MRGTESVRADRSASRDIPTKVTRSQTELYVLNVTPHRLIESVDLCRRAMSNHHAGTADVGDVIKIALAAYNWAHSQSRVWPRA
jgi:hypothetical protein